MIIGIGIDLCEIQRVANVLARRGDAFVRRILNPTEYLDYSELNHDRRVFMLAKRFAAKEAFSKALGTGIGRGFGFQDLAVQHDKSGRPELVLNVNNLALHKALSYRIHLSLSDERNHAIAFCTIES